MCKLFIEAGVIALTAFISPYSKDRDMVRQMVDDGDFIEIFCDCNIDICERRDVKGLYTRARKGEIINFTGISAPYEKPINPEIMIDTGNTSLETCVNILLKYLEKTNVINNI
jgi:adenylylsulfate kinase